MRRLFVKDEYRGGPAKMFNLAGMQTTAVVVPNAALRLNVACPRSVWRMGWRA